MRKFLWNSLFFQANLFIPFLSSFIFVSVFFFSIDFFFFFCVFGGLVASSGCGAITVTEPDKVLHASQLPCLMRRVLLVVLSVLVLSDWLDSLTEAVDACSTGAWLVVCAAQDVAVATARG